MSTAHPLEIGIVTFAGPRGALFAERPAEVVDRSLWEHRVLGHSRFLAQVGLGGLPQADTLRSIGLLATEVLPEIRAAIDSERAPER
ncbi:MAG: hypothetical protein HGA51_01400 [Demequinaceae bacterium]|nr:hypothetical protein [Demequinaceae bacterium]